MKSEIKKLKKLCKSCGECMMIELFWDEEKKEKGTVIYCENYCFEIKKVKPWTV